MEARESRDLRWIVFDQTGDLVGFSGNFPERVFVKRQKTGISGQRIASLTGSNVPDQGMEMFDFILHLHGM